ncbi:MAG: FAD-binding oxidoreductase [Alphaproteobacteria bacterium]|nr:MAG: FAD-binding oxidoreductase [Alphaproteobacteria bacterium]
MTAPGDPVLPSYPPSYYAATRQQTAGFPPPAGRVRADVAVVGGGYTGVSTALHLAEAGVDVVLLEARRIGWGASGVNGGQLGSGQRWDVDELEAAFGITRARALWELAEEAKALVKERIARHDIACHYRPGILHVAHRPRFVPAYAALAEKLQREYGYDRIEVLDRSRLAEHIGSDRYFGGLYDRGAGHLHPLNLALGLAQAAHEAGARLHEAAPVQRYRRTREGLELETPQATVLAERMVLACNAYINGLEPRIRRYIMPIHNYIIATEPLGKERAQRLLPTDAAVADSKFVVDYFRLSEDGRLLFGGGESYRPDLRRDVKTFVRPFMLKVFPELADVRIDFGWGGTLAVTLPRLPDFGRLDGGRVLYAQGYSGHGVALANLAGRLIAEALLGEPERFDLMASLPVPPFPGGRLLRWPVFVAGMLYYALRDRL